MNSRSFTRLLLPLTIILAGSVSFPQSGPITNARKPATIIKVGITEYSKVQTTYDNYDRLFRELAASADPSDPVTFSFALGTYGEVRDWYDKGLIDVAILSAMPVGELLLAGESKNLAQAYVGDISVSSAPSPDSIIKLSLSSNSAADPDAAFKYRPICIGLHSDKKLEAIANDANPISKLRELWNQGQLKFLFVRPYSMSGYIVPMTVLRANNIDPLDINNPSSQRNKVEFTYEHFKSLERLVDINKTSEIGKQQHVVAFVLDDARFNLRQQLGAPEDLFRRIPIKGLDNFTIPREVVVANYHQNNEEIFGPENKFTRTRNLMTRLFANWSQRIKSGVFTRPEKAPVIRFRPRDDWQADYGDVKQMLDQFSLPRELLQKGTLDDLLNDVISSKSPRLAVVLSGGGAKCAYQAGAIVAIEKKLKEKRDARVAELRNKGMPEAIIQEELKKLDIGLVVGTSGGAINALLVAMGVTKPDDKQPENPEHQLRAAWQSFNQQQFLRPSQRFRILFGLCFGILQAFLVAVAVLLFGRQTMNWTATILLLIALGFFQFLAALYFHLPTSMILLLFGAQTAVILIIIGGVIIVDRVLRRWTRRAGKKSPLSKLHDSDALQIEAVERESQHWRRLTIVLLFVIGSLEALFAITPRLERLVNYLPDNHWIEHGWTAALLTAKWSYPYPLVIAIIMAVIGWKLFRNFDWNRWREPLVLWTGVFLVGLAALLVLDGLFRGSSASKVDGIEEAVMEKMPTLIRQTVNPNFNPSGNTLQSFSREIMEEHLLQRDLIITSSKLPAKEDNTPLPVNALPDDIYFYYRNGSLKPPPSQSFIPLSKNPDMLLDVVIGSSTIYPIFPSRPLSNIKLGSDEDLSNAEEQQRKTISTMRIIDGGFIHNIPIEAAQRWRATHIIVIEASPSQQQRVDPRDLWDHALTAFGYLFDQAQRTDILAEGQGASAFILRPTSECEKLNAKPVCTDNPDPNLDTFDFSKRAATHAFEKGLDDVRSPNPLFVRVSGAPRWYDPELNKPQPLLAARLSSRARLSSHHR